MNLCKKAILLGVFALALGIFTEGYAYDPARKLGRGLTNAGLGMLEVPLKIYDVNQDEGGIAACTYGVFKGLGYGIARECVGVLDTATFMMPLPGCPDDPNDAGWGTGPIMQPEWIIDTEHNAYNIVYQNTALVE